MASMRLVWQSSLRAARLSAFQQGGSAARRHVSPFHSTAFNAKLAKEQLQKFERNDPVDYQELKPIADMPSDDVLLIDVREPDEVILGSIPSSVNLPLSEWEKAMAMDEADFLRAYAFRKPSKQQPIILYCRSGKRSETALDLAKKRGYSNARNYQGSWLDWSAKQKQNPDYDD